ncbi:MAG: DUF3422 domain-containing protein [Rhizobiales bacterium]|nr:DUF3422 domain-containing protein [Hyphomicrobiales bacterium]
MHNIISNKIEIDRYLLNDEIHARPFFILKSPFRCCHFVYLNDEYSIDADLVHIKKLCTHFNVEVANHKTRQIDIDLGEITFRWERHSEFSTYTFITKSENSIDFSRSASQYLEAEWMKNIPGELLHAMHIQTVKAPTIKAFPDISDKYLNGNPVIGGLVADGQGTLLTDLRYCEDGFIRYILIDHGHSPDRMGRTLQYVLELETYRMMAMISHPIAIETSSALGKLKEELNDISNKMADINKTQKQEVDSDRLLMARLMSLSAEVEQISMNVSYRFSATKAYYNIVKRRIAILREERLPKTQRITSFFARRLGPAMHTCDTVSERLKALSARVTRNASMLRTRVDLVIEEQNQALLKSMDKRADIQLRLQETVEGLSVVAISYYSIGILHFLLKATAKLYPIVEPTLFTGLASPFLVFLVIMMVRRVKKKLKKMH